MIKANYRLSFLPHMYVTIHPYNKATAMPKDCLPSNKSCCFEKDFYLMYFNSFFLRSFIFKLLYPFQSFVSFFSFVFRKIDFLFY